MQHHQYFPVFARSRRLRCNPAGFSLLEVLITWFIFVSTALTIRITLSKQLWQLNHMYQHQVALSARQLYDKA